MDVQGKGDATASPSKPPYRKGIIRLSDDKKKAVLNWVVSADKDTKDDIPLKNSDKKDNSIPRRIEYVEKEKITEESLLAYQASMTKPSIVTTDANPKGDNGIDIEEENEEAFDRNRRSEENNDNSPPDKMIWEVDGVNGDCDCLGPPPAFLLPPPPRPPMMGADVFCGEPVAGLEACSAEPKLDASYHSGPSVQTSAAIALCSVVLVSGILIGALVVWKHKRKMSNNCKTSSTSRSARDIASLASVPASLSLGPVYEDLPDVRLNEPLRGQEAPMEMMSSNRTPPPFKYHTRGRTVLTGEMHPPLADPRVFVCEPCCGELCAMPLYEELPRRPSDQSLAHSDEHFAEDELSLVGEHGVEPPRSTFRPPTSCRACQPARPARGGTRQDRRAVRRREPEFHEGLLLDALLRLYPTVGTVGKKNRGGRPLPPPLQPPAPGAWPGDVPLLGNHPNWRPPRNVSKPPSQDSSFGSDSGYSNNTCGTRGSSRHRLSAHSTELGLS